MTLALTASGARAYADDIVIMAGRAPGDLKPADLCSAQPATMVLFEEQASYRRYVALFQSFGGTWNLPALNRRFHGGDDGLSDFLLMARLSAHLQYLAQRLDGLKTTAEDDLLARDATVAATTGKPPFEIRAKLIEWLSAAGAGFSAPLCALGGGVGEDLCAIFWSGASEAGSDEQLYWKLAHDDELGWLNKHDKSLRLIAEQTTLLGPSEQAVGDFAIDQVIERAARKAVGDKKPLDWKDIGKSFVVDQLVKAGVDMALLAQYQTDDERVRGRYADGLADLRRRLAWMPVVPYSCVCPTSALDKKLASDPGSPVHLATSRRALIDANKVSAKLFAADDSFTSAIGPSFVQNRWAKIRECPAVKEKSCPAASGMLLAATERLQRDANGLIDEDLVPFVDLHLDWMNPAASKVSRRSIASGRKWFFGNAAYAFVARLLGAREGAAHGGRLARWFMKPKEIGFREYPSGDLWTCGAHWTCMNPIGMFSLVGPQPANARSILAAHVRFSSIHNPRMRREAESMARLQHLFALAYATLGERRWLSSTMAPGVLGSAKISDPWEYMAPYAAMRCATSGDRKPWDRLQKQMQSDAFWSRKYVAVPGKLYRGNETTNTDGELYPTMLMALGTIACECRIPVTIDR